MTGTLSDENHLEALARQLSGVRVIDLFDAEADRASDCRCEAAGLILDYSKHLLNKKVREALLQRAESADLSGSFENLTGGAPVNVTEERPALHTLLRGTRAGELPSLFTEVEKVNASLIRLVTDVHEGKRCGFARTPFTDVVNLGIGGSDFGPRMVCRALRSSGDKMTTHFVANVDPQDLDETLSQLNPATTFFIVCSKSFTTEETLTNALRARDWLLASGAGEDDVAQHMVAVTTNISAAGSFGIQEADCFPIWDWVGGRYSLWSAVGLSVALQGGWSTFANLLAGARSIDEHTQQATGKDNLPLMLSLLELWNTRYLHSDTHVVLPYSQRLEHLPDFLQQLSMESNGKRVDLSGAPLSEPTAPVLWGSAGTIGQHSYYQLLHQGNRRFTADIILPLTNEGVDRDAHRKLAANALAQSRALLTGRDKAAAQALAQERGQPDAFGPHYEMPGNHGHSLIYFNSVTPNALGALIAAYEHKTFFLSRLLGINAFDQWGVELGKVIGRRILKILETGEGFDAVDDATAVILRAWRDANPEP